MFEPQKPDVAAYSHFLGNFGPGRPGGTDQPFDNGTSAAAPVCAGVAALLLCAYPTTTPAELKQALIAGTAVSTGGAPRWNADLGYGLINALSSYEVLERQRRGVGGKSAA
jgi:subtilisin family serine protease